MIDDDAWVRAALFTERGGAVLDAVFDRAIRLHALAGAVRADRAVAGAGGDEATGRLALDYLVEIDALRVISPEGTDPALRVYVLT